MSVDRVWRRGVLACIGCELGRLEGDSRREWIAGVTIAVWVTLRGIIVFLTGAFRTIWAASAMKIQQVQTNYLTSNKINSLTVT